MTTWRFSTTDRTDIWVLVCLPFIAAIPSLVFWSGSNPMLYLGQMAVGVSDPILRGVPYADPNNGFGTQALGHLAALEWLRGTVPWWNYFSGVGLPLAAEYQPAAFFPTSFAHLVPQGIALQQAGLQALTGIGTYGLLRQIGSSRFAATAGGLLYAFNGTLAWHSHAAATAVPFLPWMLWGIERAYVSSIAGTRGGWRLLAAAVAMGLLSGFPETSFLSGLLAFAWALMRGLQCPAENRAAFAMRVVTGGLLGISLAAPQLYAFFQYLPQAHIGDHAAYANSILKPVAILPSLLTPYAYGPIFGYAWGKPLFEYVWGGIGGFTTGAVLASALYGYWVRRDALSHLLLAWAIVALGRSFAIEPFLTLANLIPGVTLTAFPRYAPPSWELALVILCARGIDSLVMESPRPPRTHTAALAVTISTMIAAVFGTVWIWPELSPDAMRHFAMGSLAWLGITLALIAVLQRNGSARSGRVLAVLLCFEAIVATFIPNLSNPSAGRVDIPAIHFLRNNLGLNRYYSLGPLEANYGAYFGIASINHNYLPVSSRWVDWIKAHLDRHANPIVFNGSFPRDPGSSTQADELRRNLANYEWVGVKYVVARAGEFPLSGISGVRRVYSDGLMGIDELPRPAPYFETEDSKCKVEGFDRETAATDCPIGTRLIRRELFFPGWRATINGREAPITPHRDLFQSIDIPPGKSQLRFRYAPPNVELAWLFCLSSLLIVAGSFVSRRRSR